ncbi:mitochondrial import protein Pam17-domain-containing protein [Gamsiella multidivaricata]|uniref:mitochondrial import protein Pam17-domain-containing protein n=1 Tax=Gamsiella multidivaricata TaxID=101098 RepID=UPI00221FEDA8|nr:mitochondrial import protein Pam17-domain-containing protein [Gamsiella multidivaricata]KAG0367991.1 TIM23 complex component [Gamsiella multidivaricata]KAI7819085.1 mitochondrial import protein Pam17-domain-containing protein [Gamsiella multidivaricata]
MTTTALTMTFFASGRSLASLTSKSVLSKGTCMPIRAPSLSSDMTAFTSRNSSSPSTWTSRRLYSNGISNDGRMTHPQPTTSSSGNPPPLSSKSTHTAKSPAIKAGEAAKEQAAKQGTGVGAGESGEMTMDWNSYFLLRRTRRNYERLFMAPCALTGLLGAGYYFAQKDFDPTPIFGMDQVVVYFAGTAAAGIAGLAVGPVVGNMVFRAMHSRARPLVDRMDKEFHKHIVKNRADPTANSVRNPVPDYYGEKIKSVSEYRKWLRKQREYRRKATFFVGVD